MPSKLPRAIAVDFNTCSAVAAIHTLYILTHFPVPDYTLLGTVISYQWGNI
jgi:hypothetical protein